MTGITQSIPMTGPNFPDITDYDGKCRTFLCFQKKYIFKYMYFDKSATVTGRDQARLLSLTNILLTTTVYFGAASITSVRLRR